MKKILVVFLFMVLVFPCSISIVRGQEVATPAQDYSRSVVREVLASGHPGDAEGRVLELVRYTIPAGASLPPHIHPGMQIERVEFGVLTYCVVKGSAKMTRADGTEEEIQAGQATILRVGDSLTEPGGMVHYGKNESASPTILLSAALFDEKKPKAILMSPANP